MHNLISILYTIPLVFVFSISAPFNVLACDGCITFPADAGFVNVKDFGAKGDGITDDTAAINAALSASGSDTGETFWQDKIVYLPIGTYLVSDTITKRYPNGRYASGAILIGQHRDKVIIRLQDAASGFGSADKPKAIIRTSAKLLDGNATSGGKDYINKGEGNDAFMNYVQNLSLDTGRGNKGAIGIDYLANNMGAVRNVTINGNDSEAVGINLTRKWPGPALLQNVEINGFNVGVDVDNTEYGITMERITLNNQKGIGIRNRHNVISASDITIKNSRLPISNEARDGLIVLINGDISGSGQDESITNNGFMNIRGLKINGYVNVFGAALTNGVIDGVYKGSRRTANSSQKWSLPVENPPSFNYDPAKDWASIVKFGAEPDSGKDSAPAIKAAFASGAATVYFPHGVYHIGQNITVPPHVKRIVGMTSTIRALATRPAVFSREQGMFRTANTEALIIESLAFDNSYLGDQVGVEAIGSGELILRDIVGAGVTTLSRHQLGGKVFVENTCCGNMRIAGRSGVWARQLNTEGGGTRITNRGAPLWVLGFKTERNCTVLENTDNASAEMLGGLVYIVSRNADPAIPVFKNNNSNLLASFAEESFYPDSVYSIYMENIKGGKLRAIKADTLPKRKVGRMAAQISSAE